MSKNILTSVVTSIVSIVVIATVVLFMSDSKSLGSTIETVRVKFGGGIQVSAPLTEGSIYTLIKSGTCTLLANTSITATSTGNVDCAITGIKSGDLVFMRLAASTTLASQYVMKSAQASTTNGYATVQLINLTGATAVPAATNGFGSSTAYQIYRTATY